MLYPNPLLMSFQEWAMKVVRAYPEANVVLPFEPWKSWASELIRSPLFDGIAIPSPQPYVDWHDWARDLYRQSLALTASA